MPSPKEENYEDADSDDTEMGDDSSSRSGSWDERRAHHNALERRRRDHIKESFNGLRDAVPSMKGAKVSRAQILTGATDYIVTMEKRNKQHSDDIGNIRMQNGSLEKQIAALAKIVGITQQDLAAGGTPDSTTAIPMETGRNTPKGRLSRSLKRKKY